MLEALKQGAKITWPDDWYLWGFPDTYYIEVGWDNQSYGLWILNEQGLQDALNDMEEGRKEML